MDNLRTHLTVCAGGLVTNVDPITQASALSGSAIRMINYEPALSGGYRRISGFQNDFGTVTGTGQVLGVNVNGTLMMVFSLAENLLLGITIYTSGTTAPLAGML